MKGTRLDSFKIEGQENFEGRGLVFRYGMSPIIRARGFNHCNGEYLVVGEVFFLLSDL